MGTNSQKKDILLWLNQTDIPLSVISKKSRVSRATLYNWKTNATKVGNKGAKKIIDVFKDEIHIATKDINVEGNIKIKHGKEGDGLEAQYIIDLQKDKIESQANKISLLEKQLIDKPISLIDDNIPDWNTIGFDVKTTQEYDLKSNYKYFKTYEMKHYKDFYKKLGYTTSEAETEWKKHQYAMTQGSKEFDYESNLICDKENSSEFMWDNKLTSDFFVNNSKSSIINALQCYKIGYKHKNGSVVHAQIYVMYDFVNMRSKSKIKFIPNLN